MRTSLPVNIEELLVGNIVESDRLEFREGWNPESILRTICAFANDINNVGGGYIVIGVSFEDGKIQLPPKGIANKDIDKIQQDLLSLTHLIQPHYLPVFSVEKYANKSICVLWVPGGH